MKSIFKNTLAVLALTTFFVSCSNDDSSPADEGTKGDAEIFFDNGVAGDALIIGNTYTNSNGESLTINRLNYIISNIVLIKEDGTEFVYSKEESYFVINHANELQTVHLEAIPAGDYKKVRFGLGVDQQRYLQGEAAQQDFWDLATANDLALNWATGYRFINFEGIFTANGSEAKDFHVYQGSNSAIDNYREVTLDLPTTARVREGEAPSIHIKVDANVILDGINKIKLGDNITDGSTSATISEGENLIKIAQNTLNMFRVDHVHNGAGHHE